MPIGRPFLRLAAVLFLTWALLSGHFDAAHLGAGAVASLLVAAATARLWELPPDVGPARGRPFADLRWGRALLYLVWLVREIAVSAAQVAYLVLHPRLPIDPGLVRFRATLPHTLARLTLANSITLTPGTVTLEVDRDDFLVHALIPASAGSLGAGRMQNRVAALFAGPAPPPPSGDAA
jgi:multicomponent Na+:H+ antiporter subunit E